jgi:hypothetical protein
VDLKREELFESIGQYSDLLVMQIDKWKSGLLTRTAGGQGFAEKKILAQECMHGNLTG